jgi:hypothetical protein
MSATMGWWLVAWGEASPVDSPPSSAPTAVVVVDLFDTSTEEIRQYANAGHVVTCYYSAGTSESWRADVKADKAAWNNVAVGTMAQWGGEAWLDITKLAELQALMAPRIALAASKGCAAVEPDNTDCFTNMDECQISGTKAGAQCPYFVFALLRWLVLGFKGV